MNNNESNGKTKARDHDLLIRIDERTSYMMDKMVTREEFLPVKRITYGIVAVLLTGTIMGILAIAIPG